jgi:hypothetical protein
MKITDLISKVGTNPYFIAFNAHWGFAFAAMVFVHKLWFLPVALIVASLKEFWFDANYEVPKQTPLDNWSDFAGYTFGLLLASWYLNLF